MSLCFSSRSFLKIHKVKSCVLSSSALCQLYEKYYSQRIIQSKLSEIRSKIKDKEYDDTFEFDKENYLQRYNLNPSKVLLEKHPILLNKRSLTDIKNLLYLLDKRCGFNDDTMMNIYKKYPLIIELHPNDVIKCLNKFKNLGFNNYKSFLRLEPSILLFSTVFLDRLKLYKEILNEIGIENGCELLEKYCVHIIQREAKCVLATLRYYEQIGLNVKELIVLHPQCMIYTLSHIKKVIYFIHENVSDVKGFDIKIIQILPQILGINLDKLKKIISWLKAMDLFQISEILNQCPHLLICNDVERLDESFKSLFNDYAISKSKIKNNLCLLLLRKDSIDKRVNVMKEYNLDLSDDSIQMIQLLQYDHNHIHRIIKHQQQTD